MTTARDHAQLGSLDGLRHNERDRGRTDHVQSSLYDDCRPIAYPPEIIEQFIRSQEEVVGKKMQLDPHSCQHVLRRPRTCGCRRIRGFHDFRFIFAPAFRRSQRDFLHRTDLSGGDSIRPEAHLHCGQSPPRPPERSAERRTETSLPPQRPAEKHAAQYQSGHLIGVRQRIGKAQRAAPRTAEQQPALDVQMPPQPLHVGDQMRRRVVGKRT